MEFFSLKRETAETIFTIETIAAKFAISAADEINTKITIIRLFFALDQFIIEVAVGERKITRVFRKPAVVEIVAILGVKEIEAGIAIFAFINKIANDIFSQEMMRRNSCGFPRALEKILTEGFE